MTGKTRPTGPGRDWLFGVADTARAPERVPAPVVDPVVAPVVVAPVDLPPASTAAAAAPESGPAERVSAPDVVVREQAPPAELLASESRTDAADLSPHVGLRAVVLEETQSGSAPAILLPSPAEPSRDEADTPSHADLRADTPSLVDLRADVRSDTDAAQVSVDPPGVDPAASAGDLRADAGSEPDADTAPLMLSAAGDEITPIPGEPLPSVEIRPVPVVHMRSAPPVAPRPETASGAGDAVVALDEGGGRPGEPVAWQDTVAWDRYGPSRKHAGEVRPPPVRIVEVPPPMQRPVRRIETTAAPERRRPGLLGPALAGGTAIVAGLALAIWLVPPDEPGVRAVVEIDNAVVSPDVADGVAEVAAPADGEASVADGRGDEALPSDDVASAEDSDPIGAAPLRDGTLPAAAEDRADGGQAGAGPAGEPSIRVVGPTFQPLSPAATAPVAEETARVGDDAARPGAVDAPDPESVGTVTAPADEPSSDEAAVVVADAVDDAAPLIDLTEGITAPRTEGPPRPRTRPASPTVVAEVDRTPTGSLPDSAVPPAAAQPADEDFTQDIDAVLGRSPAPPSDTPQAALPDDPFSRDSGVPGFDLSPGPDAPSAGAPVPPGLIPDAETLASLEQPVEIGAPRIVVHLPPSSRGAMPRSVAGALTSTDGSLESTMVSVEPKVSRVRFFHVQDRAAAQELRRRIAAAEGDWDVRLDDFTDFSPSPRVGTIEIWLKSAF